jgi:hypothetical protein
VSGDTNLPCEPSTASVGTCNSREFSVPSLFNVNNLGPFFHNASVSSVSSAVSFYATSTFAASPADNALGSMNVPISISSQITSFLIGLSVRPYTMTAGPIRFGLQATNGGPTAAQSISITNTSSTSITFFSPGCFLSGIDATQFLITSCPLSAPLAAGQTAIVTVAFDPNSVGLKSATLEVNTAIPSGVDLFGVGDVMPPAPTLTGIVGTSGTADGGDAVTLTGSNFLNGATVTIGGARAGFIKVVSPTSITARTGPHAPGAADVVVMNPDGQSATLVSGYSYTAAVPLSLASVAPSSGSSLGSSVAINGAGFQGGTVVMFGGLPAFAVNVLTSTTLTATAPPHAAGTVDLCVMNPDTTQVCVPNGYAYVAAQAPVLSAVSPTSGSYLGGFDVTVQGSNFAPGATVLLGGSSAAVITLSPTTIRARTGPHAPGVVDVVVMNGDGQTAIRPNAYTFLPPTITSISPTSGAIAGGTNVIISGTGFAVGATVTFGGQPATPVFLSPTSISTTAPAHAAGSVDVVVTNPDGLTVARTNGFSYVSPTITFVSPTTGTTAVGTRVTVAGTAIGPNAAVMFGGVAGSNVSSTETSVSATTPPHTAGPVDVVVTTATGATVTRTSGYTYILPTISSVFPNAGGTAGGTSVSISGTGFAPGAAVTFGGASASNVITNSETLISATTPAHNPGVVDVVVTQPRWKRGHSRK